LASVTGVEQYLRRDLRAAAFLGHDGQRGGHVPAGAVADQRDSGRVGADAGGVGDSPLQRGVDLPGQSVRDLVLIGCVRGLDTQAESWLLHQPYRLGSPEGGAIGP
jgi:hypothetical protein